MNDQLKDLLRRLVREAIDSQQQATQTQGNHPDQQQGNQTDLSQDQNQMSDADQKKLADLTKKQAQFNDAVRKIDGEAQKLQEPVRRKMEDLQRKKAKAQQGLGSTTDQISSIKKKYNMNEGNRTMKRSDLKALIKEMINEVDLLNKKKTYTVEELTAVIFNDKNYQGKRLGGYLNDLLLWTLFQNSHLAHGKTQETPETVKRLSRLGFTQSQIADIRAILANVAKPISDYMVKRSKDPEAYTTEPYGQERTQFSAYEFLPGSKAYKEGFAEKYYDFLRKAFEKKLSSRQDLLTPEGSPKNAYLQEGKKGLSGMKKASEKKDNTQMKSGDKTITKTTTPKEKTETKKLPVVKKPAQPKGEKIKEEILKMVRDVIRENVTEMARTAVELGDDGIVHGSVSTANRKQDPKSPTGWSIVGHKKFPDGTPCDAPKNTGANYVKKNPSAPSGSMGRPKKEVSSTVTVNVNGKSIDQFNFKLPTGRDDTRPLKIMVEKFFYEKNPEMAAYGLDPSVYTKFEEMADLYIDDALPANAIVDLSVKNVGGEQVLVAK